MPVEILIPCVVGLVVALLFLSLLTRKRPRHSVRTACSSLETSLLVAPPKVRALPNPPPAQQQRPLPQPPPRREPQPSVTFELALDVEPTMPLGYSAAKAIRSQTRTAPLFITAPPSKKLKPKKRSQATMESVVPPVPPVGANAAVLTATAVVETLAPPVVETVDDAERIGEIKVGQPPVSTLNAKIESQQPVPATEISPATEFVEESMIGRTESADQVESSALVTVAKPIDDPQSAADEIASKTHAAEAVNEARDQATTDADLASSESTEVVAAALDAVTASSAPLTEDAVAVIDEIDTETAPQLSANVAASDDAIIEPDECVSQAIAPTPLIAVSDSEISAIAAGDEIAPVEDPETEQETLSESVATVEPVEQVIEAPATIEAPPAAPAAIEPTSANSAVDEPAHSASKIFLEDTSSASAASVTSIESSATLETPAAAEQAIVVPQRASISAVVHKLPDEVRAGFTHLNQRLARLEESIQDLEDHFKEFCFDLDAPSPLETVEDEQKRDAKRTIAA